MPNGKKEVLKTSILWMTLIFGEMVTRNCLFPYISKTRAVLVFQNEVLDWANEFERVCPPGGDYLLEIREFTLKKLREKGFLKEDKPKSIPSDALTKEEFEKTVQMKAQFDDRSPEIVAEENLSRLGHACVDCCFPVSIDGNNGVCSCCKSPNFLETIEDRNTCEEWRLRHEIKIG